MFSCEYCEILKNHHFEEDLQTTVSYFMNKNRNNSSKKNLNQWKSMGFQFRKHSYKEKFKEIAYNSK